MAVCTGLVAVTGIAMKDKIVVECQVTRIWHSSPGFSCILNNGRRAMNV